MTFRMEQNETRAPSGRTVAVLDLAGHYDSVAAVPFKERLLAIADGCDRIVLNCAGVEFMASAAIGSILTVLHPVRQKGGDIKVAGLSRKVATVFSLLGLQEVLDVVPDVATAARRFDG